jgi:NAD(P)-dependent dehydrogenase (short-subunit alcohol dehydrogenase family)
MTQSLKKKVALVAGATRGAGRGIAVELGAAGATVYVTGRSTRARGSEYDRPETIEETAELIAAAGGHAIAVPLGLRILHLAIDTHLITAHHALPLLLENPGGLLIEVNDGTTEYNATHYRINPFYDLAKVAVNRMAWAHAHDLQKRAATAVSITPGWMRSELMLDAYQVEEKNWRDAAKISPHFIISETTRFVGRAVVALASDPERARWNGQSVSSGQLAQIYGFTDLDGSRPDAWRYIAEVEEPGKPADATGYR